MKEYVIEGHDGAAKTPIALGVKQSLLDVGLKADLYAPFHLVKAKISEPDIYPYWAKEDSAQKALELLASTIQEIRKDANENGLDILLYDRHWMTILTEIDQKPTLVWQDFLPTFFMEAPVQKTMSAKRFSFDTPWTSSKNQVKSYYEKYLDLAQRYSQHIVGRYVIDKPVQDLSQIINSVVSHITQNK